MTRIGVTYDGNGQLPEGVRSALASLGDVVALPTNAELPARLRRDALDIVFSVAPRADGVARRLQVAAFLDYFGIPFVGGDALAQATCLQRSRMKETLSYHGVATAAFTLVEREEQAASLARRAFPVRILRARQAHDNRRAQIANDFDELLEFVRAQLGDFPDEPLLIEAVLPGDAFSCAMIGNGSERVLLPIVSHDDEAETLDAAVAMHGSTRPRERAARLNEGLIDEIEALASRTWDALGCRDIARIDVQLNDAGVPHVTAVDPLPSLTSDDADETMRAAIGAAGLGDHEFLQRCLLIAAKRAHVEIAAAPAFQRLPRRTPP